MMWRVLISVVTTLRIVLCDREFCPRSYSRGQYLDPSTQKYHLCWKVDWSDRFITFSANVSTTGWIGLGFSPTGFMTDSDMIIGWVKDGRGYLQDRFATGRVEPLLDENQNVKLLSFSEADGRTTLEFRRALDACDSRDRSIEKGTTRVVFSYNPNDPVSETTLDKHTFAGRVSINLLSATGNVEAAPLEANYKTVDVLNRNVSVPAKFTTYWCTPFKLPQLHDEVHMIRFEPVVQANHSELVHHIVIYSCHEGLTSHLNTSWECNDPLESVPDSIRRCRGASQIAAWAVGGAGMSFPLQVGLPMSGPSGTQYLLMETHYNNEHSRSDYVDSSGIRIFYTPTKRRFDAAILEFGHVVNKYGFQMLLPPRRDDVITENICPAACTEAGLPSDGVNVFGVMLHSHTAGKGIWVEHSRNGVRLPNIDSNYNYDFNFQDIVLLQNEVKVLPGDDVQVFCDYDTTKRDHVTVGGEGTQEEMCVAFFLVYPKPQLAICLSQISTKHLQSYLTQAFLRNYYYIDYANMSTDPEILQKQVLQSVTNMKFSREDEYTLWEQQYWSMKEREYLCFDYRLDNLLGAEYFNYTVLPTIRESPTVDPTCSGVTNTSESSTSTSKQVVSTTSLADQSPSPSAVSSANQLMTNLFWVVLVATVIGCE
ncbi:DBH-like monooxygenase protein 1 homolog [Corticium candelabrum]|uniref:DBH-like monooxygenase protein 1 homolog n=1 Tax=Corticium candelabrum TaxID=121492 RepID=UPI002E2648FA|nr:DBH-like monooxygenase protein 1 homolog [Corticium candelabrum]